MVKKYRVGTDWGGTGGTAGVGVQGSGCGLYPDSRAQSPAQRGEPVWRTNDGPGAYPGPSGWRFATVERVRRRCVEEGVDAALGRREQLRRRQRKLKPPSDFDQSRWMLDHTALVNDERAAKERIGYTVHTENRNLFRLRGATATIAGKPDLIAENKNEVEITDAKTGKPSPTTQPR